MLHANGHSIYYDANTLEAVPPQEKQEMLNTILGGICDQDIKAGNTAYCLGVDIAGISEGALPSDASYETETSHGELPSWIVLSLVRNMPRLQGFINAIKRWPEQKNVIDVGCGSFPVLALSAALYHPKAEVTALEINPDSAEAASKIVNAFGLSNRVNIISTDFSDYIVESNTTAAVTETFNAALQEEPGPKIVQRLHSSGVQIITPSSAELCLTFPKERIFFQKVDLRRDTHASIQFSGWSCDPKNFETPRIRAAYYDDFGLVLPKDTDIISKDLGFTAAGKLRKIMKNADESGRLVYELGAHPFDPAVEA